MVKEYPNCRNRKDEVIRFHQGYPEATLLILDDDTSLGALPQHLKDKWVKTSPLKGFNQAALEEAIRITESM